MLKETFKMRKIGKHLVNVSMLGLAVAPIAGSALAPVTVLAAEYKSGQDGSNKLEFTTKSSTSSTSTTAHEPMDLIQIVDLSGSLSDGEFKSRFGYTGARRQQLTDMIYVIQNKLTDQDHVMLAFYGTNNQKSYETNGQDGSAVTKLLSKSEALDILNRLLKEPKVMEMSQSWELIPNVVAPMLGDKAIKTTEHKGFEQIYQEQSNRNKVVSALQFTDDWVADETIDSSFAEWAKKNAKTFMTVVDGGGGSVDKMKAAGHPNIMVYGLADKNKAGRSEEIAKQFESTATITKTTTTKQKAHVSITPDEGVTLTKASLVSADGKTTDLKINGNKVLADLNDLADGKYTVNYSFKGDVTSAKKIVSSVSIDGKDVDKKEDTILPVAKPTVRTEKIPFQTETKEDPTLPAGEKKVVQEGVEGVIKVTTTYETQKGEKVKGSEKVTEVETVKKVDKIIAVGIKGSKSEVTEKKVPFETIYKQDSTLKKGEEKVLQEGVEGLIKVTTTYETQKGQKVDGSEKVTEQTVTEKVDKIVAQGTMEKRKIRYRVVDSKGQELVKQTDVMEAYQDEEYKVETPKLDGYRLELAKDSVPATGKVADRDVLVTFVAVKIGKPVTLKFVDESGTEIAQKKVLTGEKVDVDTEFSGEAPATIEKDGVKYAFVGIKQTGSKERKVSGKVTDKEQVIEAVYSKPKELPKTNEQSKQRNTVIVALLSVVGLGGLVTYFGLRKRDEK